MRRLPDVPAGGGSPRRRRSTFNRLDDALLVVVVVVAALLVLKFIGLVVSTVIFVLTLATVAAVLYIAARLALRRR